ncbi:MAG: glycoside hydrolase family 2 TIM barrel-domain containing protein [Patescibacteria group bacterium]
MKRRVKLLIVLIITIPLSQLIILSSLIYFNYSFSIDKITLGTTFAPQQARYFGLDPKKVLTDSLDDLKIKNYRLSAYWNVIEEQKGKYNWSELDWQLAEVAKRDGNVILAIGRRLPRWPECHDPKWVKGMETKKVEDKILSMLQAVVTRYKNHQEVKAWQVENEAFLSIFGECPLADINFFKQEVALVRQLDPSRPIVITESGELSTWTPAARLGDWVGVSVYRTTWNKVFGIFYYPLTPAYYKFHARAIEPFVKKVFVSELQAEPWERGGNPLPEEPIEGQKIMMDEKKLVDSVNFSKKAGFSEIYLWGVEWWAWLKERGDSGMWEAVKNLNK